MILRSITKHMKEQDWFAVGVDFLIVVFGVFMGIRSLRIDLHEKLDNGLGIPY